MLAGPDSGRQTGGARKIWGMSQGVLETLDIRQAFVMLDAHSPGKGRQGEGRTEDLGDEPGVLEHLADQRLAQRVELYHVLPSPDV